MHMQKMEFYIFSVNYSVLRMPTLVGLYIDELEQIVNEFVKQ